MNKKLQILLSAVVLLLLAATSDYWYDGKSLDPPFIVLNLISALLNQLPVGELTAVIFFDVSILTATASILAMQNYEKKAKELSILSNEY